MAVTPYRLISLIISISLITSDTELLFICFAVVVGGGVFGHLYVLLWRNAYLDLLSNFWLYLFACF